MAAPRAQSLLRANIQSLVDLNALSVLSSLLGDISVHTVGRGSAIILALCLSLAACSADAEHQAVSDASNISQGEAEAKSQNATTALRAFAPPEGIRTTRLFSTKANSAAERLERLERAVQVLRDDVDTIAPVTLDIAKKTTAVAGPIGAPIGLRAEEKEPPPENLVPVDTETRNANIERLISASGADTGSAPSMKKSEEGASKPAPADTSAGAIRQARTADHKDMTRLVLDMTASATPRARVEDGGKKLIIDLPLPWTGEASFRALEAQLISGWQVKDGKMEVDLLYPSQIKQQLFISAQKGSNDYRFVIDLYSADIHKK